MRVLIAMQKKPQALIALTLSVLACAASAQSITPEGLRAECAAKHQPQLDAKGQAANEYRFVYYKGQYRGEPQAGQALACAEAQYAAYLDTQDPARVLSAYPTAAGRPSVSN